jgi:hypothetical protein
MSTISAVKVFSTTMARDRLELGNRVTEWLARHPELTVVDRIVTQTSDREFHCLSITLMLSGDPTAYLAEVPPQRPPSSGGGGGGVRPTRTAYPVRGS